MGSFISYMWWGYDPDEISPVSGLTKREICAVQKSWISVNADPLTSGNELFRRYLAMFPEDRMLFRWIKDLPEEKYINGNQNKSHVMNIMNTLNMVVNTMNEPEIVAAMMRRIGESHSRRKIKEDRFHGMKKVVITMYTDVLKLDDWTLCAWSKILDFWFKNIFETLNTSDDSSDRATL